MNKYRGVWRGKGESGNWYEGLLVYRSIDNTRAIIHDERTNADVWVDPSTLGECSCVPDGNSNMIFEGDICTVATPNIADDEYGVVRYDENEAVFIIDFGTYTINFCDNVNGSAVEVIGNIHDNDGML